MWKTEVRTVVYFRLLTDCMHGVVPAVRQLSPFYKWDSVVGQWLGARCHGTDTELDLELTKIMRKQYETCSCNSKKAVARVKGTD
jgi:hypothetical protein